MNTTTQPSDNLAFAGQLKQNELADLAHKGYQVLICHRPDREEVDQPLIADITAEANHLGITVIYAPVANGQFTEEVIESTRSALQLGKKTLLFCRSGRRSCIVWAILQARQGQSVKSIQEQASIRGHDLSDISTLLEDQKNKYSSKR